MAWVGKVLTLPRPYLLVQSGRLNVKNEELDAMIKEASGPINFTVFLTMFGEKLKGVRFPSAECAAPARPVPSRFRDFVDV